MDCQLLFPSHTSCRDKPEVKVVLVVELVCPAGNILVPFGVDKVALLEVRETTVRSWPELAEEQLGRINVLLEVVIATATSGGIVAGPV